MAIMWRDKYLPQLTHICQNLTDLAAHIEEESIIYHLPGLQDLGPLFGYSVASFMMVIYYGWEDSPLHHTQCVESVYLCSILALLYMSSPSHSGLIADMLYKVQHASTSEIILTMSTLQALRQLKLLIVLMAIMQQFVAFRQIPAYYDKAKHLQAQRDKRLSEIASLHPKVLYLVVRLNEQISDIVNLDNHLSIRPRLVSRILAPVMLMLIMVCELVIVYEVINEAVRRSCFILSYVIILVLLIYLARRWVLLTTQAKYVHDVILELVEHRRALYLEYVVATVSIGTLVEISGDILPLLTQRALDDDLLNTTSKGIIINALQRAGLRSRKRQNAVLRMLMSVQGDEMTKLKHMIDGTADYDNLYKLIYKDLTIRSIRDKAIRHISKQARSLRRRRGAGVGIKVLSDIDDTLYSSGGRFPAGCDTKYPRSVVYPGLMTLLRVLDKGWRPEEPSCNLVFLTARPHVYKSWSESKSYKRFKELVKRGKMHNFPTLIPGHLSSSLWAMMTHFYFKNAAWRAVGERKYKSYLKIMRLYLEYDCVFFGDDGQGDLLAGQRMLAVEGGDLTDTGSEIDETDEEDLDALCYEIDESKDDRHCNLLAVLIHQVLDQSCHTPLALDAPSTFDERFVEELRRKRLFFHKTYVRAAIDLHYTNADLVSLADLASIGNDAIDEFEQAVLMCPDGMCMAATDELRHDLKGVDELLRAAGRPCLRPLSLEKLLPRENTSESGCSRSSAVSFDWNVVRGGGKKG